MLANGVNFLRAGAIYGNAALWFLLVLFPVKNLYNAIRSERVRWIALFVSPLFAYVLNRFSINWPFLLVARYLVAACGITDPVAAVTLYVGGGGRGLTLRPCAQ